MTNTKAWSLRNNKIFSPPQNYLLLICRANIWCHADRTQRGYFGALPRLRCHWCRDSLLTRYHAIPRDVLPNDARFDFQLLRLWVDAARRIDLGDSARAGDRLVRHVLRFVHLMMIHENSILESKFLLFLEGFVISCAVDNERSATYLALGSFLPLIMLCGIIWPIEGMHPLLKAPALFLPLTLSTESLRSILQRGWPIEDPHVYIGFISTGIWILIFLTFSILLLKFKKG